MVMSKLLFSTLALAAVLFSGCTALREADSKQQEQLLVASGFEVRPANTPKKQARLAAITPYKLLNHTKNGKIVYFYANPKKEILYVGGPNQFAKYSGLLVKKTMIEQQAWTATEYQMSAEDYAMWGPFGPMSSFGGVNTPVRTFY